MTSFTRFGFALSVLAWSAAAPTTASAQRANYDVRRQHDFSSVRTFSFRNVPVSTAGTAGSTTYDGPLMDERTKAAIASQLERRGLRRDDDHPDVFVTARRSFKTEYTVYGPYGWGPYWYGPGWGPYGYGAGYYSYPFYGWYDSGPYVSESIRGTLTVDLEDAGSGALVWRGVESHHVHEKSSPSSRDRHVAEEVADVFKRFPPVGSVAR